MTQTSSSFQSRARRIAGIGLASGAALALMATAAPSAQADQTSPSSDRSRPGSYIIGGSQVADGTYPFMTALMFKGSGSGRDRQFCGGSLINPVVVMTAAHCVEGMKPKDLELAVGRTVLSSKQGKLRNVHDIVVHPRYGKGEAGYDLALLEMSKPVEGTAPIRMPTPGTDALIKPGAKATVIGWGNTNTEVPKYANRLRQVKVPLLSHDECKVAYDAYNKKVEICAGVEGKDSCQGDSGGPMFRTVPGRTPIQIGVVSWGDGCAAQGAPGVYTSLSSAKLWKTLEESRDGKRLKNMVFN
ncbi:S1 family peptidase [Streptomyces coeruleorubidus]|uniref:S1 family peptidase n=1 Tax=Streptomyces coeruleorubidus TaxID=116188 RepID=UPI0036FFD522